MSPWLLENLACPYDGTPLEWQTGKLSCLDGHHFPVVRGIPVLLRSDVCQTHGAAASSLKMAQCDDAAERLGVFEHQESINPHVQKLVSATSGFLYEPLIGKLTRYPIPDLRLPPGQGKRILDIGCNWGRWCVAAAGIGYRPVGIDPCLGSVLVAQQVCRQLGVAADLVVADARYMPFRERSIETVFSYSVLQHFSKEDARLALNECRRVMNPPATCLIQMPNKWGIRCLWHQARRRFRKPRDFEVRYWTLHELKRCFAEILAVPNITVDGFFGLGIQPSDIELLPLRFKMVVHASEMMRALSNRIPLFRYVADSLYVEVRL